MRVHYSAILDALGFYVERAAGIDVLVQELPPTATCWPSWGATSNGP